MLLKELTRPRGWAQRGGCLPPGHKYQEEYTQHHIATVTEDVVEGANSPKGVGTGKIVVAYILVTCHIQNLGKNHAFDNENMT